MVSGLVVVATVSSAMIGAQEQPSRPRGAWPCGGRIDLSYFQAAEATGGRLQLIGPGELGESAAELMIAFDSHRETIFRVAGDLKPGGHEFRVPIDSSLESVLFSISVQCLKTAEVVRPSGAPVAGGDGVTDLSNFVAQRMVIVKRPEAGLWTIRASGTGISGVMVQASSPLRLSEVAFSASGSSAFTHQPSAGIENLVRIAMSGAATDLQASVVNAAFRRMASLPLSPGESEGTYLSRFTPGTDGFRVLVEGKNAEGVPFQRVSARLFLPSR
jgi:hypothetical protein